MSLRFAVARISVHLDAPGLRNTFRRPRRGGYVLHVVLTIYSTRNWVHKARYMGQLISNLGIPIY